MNSETTRLKQLVAGSGTTLEGISAVLGIDRSTLYRKLRRGADGLTVAQARTISDYLGLSPTEKLELFLQERHDTESCQAGQ